MKKVKNQNEQVQQIVVYKPVVDELFQKQNLWNKDQNFERQKILKDLVKYQESNRNDSNPNIQQNSNYKDLSDQQTLQIIQENLSKYIQGVCHGGLVKSTSDIDEYSKQLMQQINDWQKQEEQQKEMVEEEHQNIQVFNQSFNNSRLEHQKIYLFKKEYIDKQSAQDLIQLIKNNIKQFYNIQIVKDINQFYIESNSDLNQILNDVQISQIKQQILNFFYQTYHITYNNQKDEPLEQFIVEIFKFFFITHKRWKYIQIFDRNYLSVQENVEYLLKILQKQEIYDQLNNQIIIDQIDDFYLVVDGIDQSRTSFDLQRIQQIKEKIGSFFQENFQLRPINQIKENKIREINKQSANFPLKEFLTALLKRFSQLQELRQKYQPIKIKSPAEIRRLPNGNTLFKFENISKLYCNYQFDHQLKLLRKDGFNTDQVIYEGILDQYDQPHQKGIIKNHQWKYEGEFHLGFFHGVGQFEYFDHYKIDGTFVDGNAEGECVQYFFNPKNYNIKGTFKRGQKQGSFYCSISNSQLLAFDNDVQIETQKPPSKSYPFREYGNIGIQFIDQKCFETTLDFKWMQQKVVDFYLLQLWNDLSFISDLSNINLINTCDAQDIFGSVISINNLNKDEIKKQIRRDATRTIIALNMNQSHFMACVYENNKLYLLDSICGSYYPPLLANLNQIFDVKSNQFETNLKLAYQPNGYDCGAYLCYYVHQLLRYPFTNIEKIKFNDNHEYVGEFRKRIRNILLDNYDFTFK